MSAVFDEKIIDFKPAGASGTATKLNLIKNTFLAKIRSAVRPNTVNLKKRNGKQAVKKSHARRA